MVDHKRFHEMLCERFNYPHDEEFWWRDQISLIEHIAAERDSLKAELDVLKQKTSSMMGVGNGAGNLFVYGDYDSIKTAQTLLLQAENDRAELEAARKQEPSFYVNPDNTSFEGYADISNSAAPGYVPVWKNPVPAQQAEHIADEIEDLNACLDELRAIRDGQESPIRNTLNRACDRLDVAISKLHEAAKQLEGGNL